MQFGGSLFKLPEHEVEQLPQDMSISYEEESDFEGGKQEVLAALTVAERNHAGDESALKVIRSLKAKVSRHKVEWGPILQDPSLTPDEVSLLQAMLP